MTNLGANLRTEIAEAEAHLRVGMADGCARLTGDFVNLRVDVLRWAFAFWLGQFAAIVGFLAFLLRPR